jgi:endonuclease V-like protein UPF0215 family
MQIEYNNVLLAGLILSGYNIVVQLNVCRRLS